MCATPHTHTLAFFDHNNGLDLKLFGNGFRYVWPQKLPAPCASSCWLPLASALYPSLPLSVFYFVFLLLFFFQYYTMTLNIGVAVVVHHHGWDFVIREIQASDTQNNNSSQAKPNANSSSNGSGSKCNKYVGQTVRSEMLTWHIDTGSTATATTAIAMAIDTFTDADTNTAQIQIQIRVHTLIVIVCAVQKAQVGVADTHTYENCMRPFAADLLYAFGQAQR